MTVAKTARSSRGRTRLLGGMTPAQFMRRHWQRKPLLVRGALPGLRPLLSRTQLFALAADEDVESRLIVRRGRGRWKLAHGPFAKSALPSPKRPNWTLLVQGVDLHDDAVHALLQSFRFIPDARLDDVMISWASDGGGVGPHFDSYDVFLVQAHGQRRWRIGRVRDATLEAGAPLKILRRFVPEREFVLDAGDMLYLPPHWAHDGVAVGGDCMTYSIGMRAPQRSALAGDLAARLADSFDDEALYRDPQQTSTNHPAAIPARLHSFASAAVRQLLDRADSIDAALGEALSEPKAHVLFERPDRAWRPGAVSLDRRTRMLYDGERAYINGESVRGSRKDAELLRRLADERALDAGTVRGASRTVRVLLREWYFAGWLQRRSR